jgi:hypothetical protein
MNEKEIMTLGEEEFRKLHSKLQDRLIKIFGEELTQAVKDFKCLETETHEELNELCNLVLEMLKDTWIDVGKNMYGHFVTRRKSNPTDDNIHVEAHKVDFNKTYGGVQ